jgi:hypothetical protein
MLPAKSATFGSFRRPARATKANTLEFIELRPIAGSRETAIAAAGWRKLADFASEL